MSKVTLKKETFVSEQVLELKRVEPRESKTSNEKYFMLFFNMCVACDDDNIRNNRFIDVPFYVSAEFMSENFSGCKPKELIGKKYQIVAEFTPKVRTFEGHKFADFSTNILSLTEVDEAF